LQTRPKNKFYENVFSISNIKKLPECVSEMTLLTNGFH